MKKKYKVLHVFVREPENDSDGWFAVCDDYKGRLKAIKRYKTRGWATRWANQRAEKVEQWFPI